MRFRCVDGAPHGLCELPILARTGLTVTAFPYERAAVFLPIDDPLAPPRGRRGAAAALPPWLRTQWEQAQTPSADLRKVAVDDLPSRPASASTTSVRRPAAGNRRRRRAAHPIPAPDTSLRSHGSAARRRLASGRAAPERVGDAYRVPRGGRAPAARRIPVRPAGRDAPASLDLLEHQAPTPPMCRTGPENIVAANTPMAQWFPWVREPRANLLRRALLTPGRPWATPRLARRSRRGPPVDAAHRGARRPRPPRVGLPAPEHPGGRRLQGHLGEREQRRRAPERPCPPAAVALPRQRRGAGGEPRPAAHPAHGPALRGGHPAPRRPECAWKRRSGSGREPPSRASPAPASAAPGHRSRARPEGRSRHPRSTGPVRTVLVDHVRRPGAADRRPAHTRPSATPLRPLGSTIVRASGCTRNRCRALSAEGPRGARRSCRRSCHPRCRF